MRCKAPFYAAVDIIGIRSANPHGSLSLTQGVPVSEYLRQSRSVAFGPIEATVHFGEERKCGRITCVVFSQTAASRRMWERAIERLGIATTIIERDGTVVNPKTGQEQSCITAYSCRGEETALEELVRLDIVRNWTQCETAIPYGKTTETFGKRATIVDGQVWHEHVDENGRDNTWRVPTTTNKWGKPTERYPVGKDRR
jgi:hypothetical protein